MSSIFPLSEPIWTTFQLEQVWFLQIDNNDMINEPLQATYCSVQKNIQFEKIVSVVRDCVDQVVGDGGWLALEK